MSTPGVLEYCHVRSTPGDRGHSRTDKGAHRRHRTLTRRRRSTDEASRCCALTSATSAFPAALRSIAASCTHQFSVTQHRYFYDGKRPEITFGYEKASVRSLLCSQSVPPAGTTAHADAHSEGTRTSSFAALRGLACDTTHEGVGGKVHSQCIVSYVRVTTKRVVPPSLCRSGTAAHARRGADSRGRSGASCSARGRASARAHDRQGSRVASAC